MSDPELPQAVPIEEAPEPELPQAVAVPGAATPELPQAVPIEEAPEPEVPEAVPVAGAHAPELPQRAPRAAAREGSAHPPLGGTAGLGALARISQSVMRRAGLEDVLAGIVAGVGEELGCDTATLLLLEDGVLRIKAASGLDPDEAAGVSVVIGEGFAGAVAATRQSIALPQVTSDHVRSAYLRETIRSLLGVPLIADDVLVGVLHVGWRTARQPSAEEGAFLELVGATAAAAIVRARLDDAERASRRAAEAATVRLEDAAAAAQTLERVSSLLSTSLEYERTLEHISDVLVPDIAEFCQIYLVDNDRIRRVAVACAREDRRAALDALHHRPALRVRGRSPQAAVIASGEPRLVATADDAYYAGVADDPQDLELLRVLGARSLIVAPLRARGVVTGAITVGRFDGARPFTGSDRDLVVEIGRRAGLAIDNARLYRELAEMSEAKSQFLSTMSHELRTPLNAIIGYASLLRDLVAGPLTTLQREHIGRILAASDHLLLLINEVLTLSRLDAGKERVDPTVFDLAAIAAAVGEMVGPIAATKGLRIDVAAAGPVPLRSDETKVRQILLNLLSNAIKFTSTGGVSVHVVAAADARVAVRDTGRGIALEDRERIFEPFFQVSQGTTRSEGGTGLGLTVSRRLARLLGGEIEVESEVGTGSTFTLRLPLA